MSLGLTLHHVVRLSFLHLNKQVQPVIRSDRASTSASVGFFVGVEMADVESKTPRGVLSTWRRRFRRISRVELHARTESCTLKE
jgi:hypothetical protein